MCFATSIEHQDVDFENARYFIGMVVVTLLYGRGGDSSWIFLGLEHGGSMHIAPPEQFVMLTLVPLGSLVVPLG